MSLVPFVHVEPERFDAGAVDLDADTEHHLRRVLRLDRGAGIEVSDGAGRVWPAELADDGARLTGEPTVHPAPSRALRVVQALAKGRKLDDVVQALVELGIERITPVGSERAVVRLEGPKADKAHARWTAVARSAAAQARRPWLPTIDPVGDAGSVADALAAQGGAGIVAHPAAPVPLGQALDGLPGDGEVTVAVGPEGGWTEREVERFASAGLLPATFGASVLRTEHAAFALCAALGFALGRFGHRR